MHMVAAALYKAMKDDGFDRSGGSYGAWLSDAASRGLLAPENVKRLAAQVVVRPPSTHGGRIVQRQRRASTNRASDTRGVKRRAVSGCHRASIADEMGANRALNDKKKGRDETRPRTHF